MDVSLVLRLRRAETKDDLTIREVASKVDTVMNDLMLLAMLLGGPQHGYALKKQAGMLAGKPSLHNNLVYPWLRRFVQKGWVHQRAAAGKRGQTRLVYSITAKGRQALLDRLVKFQQADARSSEAFGLRVGLFDFLPAESRREILFLRREHLQSLDERFASLQRKMDLGKYGEEVVRFKRAGIAAEIAWMERIESLERKSRNYRREK
jgi:DNA-binding PadR family transcriptional regulator